nr:maleylacetoacetate isomerase [Sphingomonas aerophila]
MHGYWRSSAAYRVRIALNLKGLEFSQANHDLRTGAQRAESFQALNPQGLVPALELDGEAFTQSSAIIELLDELHPEPPLLPREPQARARARAMAALIACDIHPLNNLRVLSVLRQEFGAGEDQVSHWIARWITEGFAALEPLIARHAGAFAFGDQPGIVDCHLVPQVYSAERFKVDLSPYPRLHAVADHASAHPAFAAAHPSGQPDADPA